MKYLFGEEARVLERLSEEELIKLLRLPDSLRKTMMAVLELGEATAGEVAQRTGRLRSSESGYLNRLVRLGYLKKRRGEGGSTPRQLLYITLRVLVTLREMNY